MENVYNTPMFTSEVLKDQVIVVTGGGSGLGPLLFAIGG